MVSGFDFTDEEIRSVRPGHLLTMEIEFSRRCNYLCPYCYAADPGYDYSKEMSPEEIRNVLVQAKEIGARKIIILGGEPLLYPDFFAMTDFISSLGMTSEVFTNGSLVTEETAAELFRRKIRVVVKLNSLDPRLHEEMTGVRDSLDRSLNALRCLQEAGYRDLDGMLGGTTVITSTNIGEIPKMWAMLRERNIAPYFECLTPQGRLEQNQGLLPDPLEVEKVFEKLAAYDRTHGREWIPQPPLAGAKCFRHFYSCVVCSNGNVLPCVGLDKVIGNIREQKLTRILAESTILRDLRDYRNRIKEPCRSCDKIDHCYGCRGTAWQAEGDHLAADPTCWNVVRFHQKNKKRSE